MNFINKHFFKVQPRMIIEFIRIFFYFFLFIQFFSFQETRGYFQLDGRYWKPTGFFTFMDFLSPPIHIPLALEIMWKTSLLFCVLGFFTNVAKWVALLLTTLFLGYLSNFYLYTANYIVVTYCLILFTFCDFGSAWSIDAWLWKKKKTLNGPVQAWSLRFIQLAIVFCWFGSGIQKLRISGLDWVFINHFKTYLVDSKSIFGHPVFFHTTAVLTLFFELLSPLVFLRKFKWTILPIMFLFHVMAIFVFEIPLGPWLACFLFWIEDKDLNALKRVLKFGS